MRFPSFHDWLSDEGTSVKWEWKNLAAPHSIYEADYCDSHGGIYRTSNE